MKKLQLLLILIGIFALNTATGQECEWLSTSNSDYYEAAHAVTSDDSNNVIACGMFQISITVDTITKYDSLASVGSSAGYVIKYRPDGVLQWIYAPKRLTGLHGQGNTYFTHVATDGGNNIYTVVNMVGRVDFGNGNIIADSGLCTVLIKLNASGVTQWARKIARGGFTRTLMVDNQDNIIAGIHHYGVNLFKYTPSGSLIRSVLFGPSLSFAYSTKSDANNNIYLMAYTDSVFAFGSQTLNPNSEKTAVLLKLDSTFAPIRGKYLYSNIPLNPGNLFYAPFFDVDEKGNAAIGGAFTGTVDFGGITLGAGTAKSAYIGFYDTAFNLRWVKKDNPSSLLSELRISSVIIRNNNIYFAGGLMGGSTSLDAFPLSFSGNQMSLFLVKMDTLSNFLWAFVNNTTTISTVMGISADSLGNLLVCGYFGVSGNPTDNKITIFDVTENGSATTNNGDLFVAKIANYSITRGNVSAGPYCAGDSIRIPYTKTGRYDPGNEFIAQLSDSSGNFEGNERELGRVTDTAGGVITGVLPLFDVATSKNYRIRIISTKPMVQSFYRKDSLRLLIFSKDTANAGNDTTVCKGNRVTLGVTGGSQWNWWPQTGFVAASDTANRRPVIQPDSTTEYRIIISDSSGCGVTDTDYIKISVRPALQITVPDKVILCQGRGVTLKANAFGGDSLNYRFAWTKHNDKKVLSDSDELFVSPFSTTRYWVKLTDGCTVQPDSATVNVITQVGLSLSKFNDTTICRGNSLTFNFKAATCDTSAVKYVWDNGLGTGPAKTVSPLTTTTYKVIAYDTINGSRDSSLVTVTVRQPLQLAVTADTTICSGNTLQLTATPSGGLPAQYKVTWTTDNILWTDTNFSITVSPAQTTIYTVALRDDCTVAPDTQRVTVTIRAPLKITVNNDTTLCVGELAQLNATASGGLPAQHIVRWTADNSPWTGTGYSIPVSPAVTTIYKAVLSDNCTPKQDSAVVKVTVRAPLSMVVSADTVICVQGTVTLTATAAGGLAPQYKIQWADENNTWTDTGFAVNVSPAATTVYTAVLSDNCTLWPDTQKTKVSVRPPLNVIITGQDTVCEGKTVTLAATLAGGNTAAHSLLWTADNNPWTSAQNPVQQVPATTTTYIATLADNCSPSAKDSFTVTVIPAPKAAFDINDTAGCAPAIVSLTDKSTGHDTLLNKWWLGATHIAGGTATCTQNFSKSGLYTFSLSVANVWGCTDSLLQYLPLTVFKVPQADFIIKPDIRETGKEIRLLNSSRGATGYEWSMGNGNTFWQNTLKDTAYTYTDSGHYPVRLVVTDDNGCSDTLIKYIRVFDALFCVVPNAFTPNGDNLNNTFAPVCNGVSNYTLTIYNRWGQVIQQCDNCAWDGTYAGDAVPAGVYLYLLQTDAQSGKKESVFGVVNVVR